MATINSENAKQIRDPMQVEISMQVGSNAKISNYAVPSTYKSYDNTLGNAEYSMRVLADLAGDGFPLDGTAKLYDPNETTSAGNGKLGYRANVGDDVTVTITATNLLTAVSVKASGISAIEYNGTSYPAASLNIIPMNTRTATLTFRVSSSIDRVAIDYIVPDITLQIDNDNLVQCTLALRGNLSIVDHTWEESEIEIQAYYPYDISDSFKYVMNEWPILYRAGYDSDMSMVRKFYLSEPVTMANNVITIKGVDASHRLNDKTLHEDWLKTTKANSRQSIYNRVVDAIQSSGITLQRKQTWNIPSGHWTQQTVIPEMTARDFVAGVMNLTLSAKRGTTHHGIQFVDAGIPTVEHGDGKTYGQTWTIFKSDCGDFNEQFERNIAKIQNTNDEHRLNETVTSDGSVVRVYEPVPEDGFDKKGGDGQVPGKNEIVEVSFDTMYEGVSIVNISPIIRTPSGCTVKQLDDVTWVKRSGRWYPNYSPSVKGIGRLKFAGGYAAYSNPNGLPGQTIEMEPFIVGAVQDSNNDQVFDYQSLFARSTRIGSFVWKGDPRMQPLDYLVIVNDTNDGRDTITARATSIELTHEGGGTTATITWREWDMDISGTVLADEHGAALIDNNGDFLSAE